MGNGLGRSAQGGAGDWHLHEAFGGNVAVKDVLGGCRLTRSLRCVSSGLDVVVKVHFRREGVGADVVSGAVASVQKSSDMVGKCSPAAVGAGLLGWDSIVETENAVYAVRPYLEWNLADRCSRDREGGGAGAGASAGAGAGAGGGALAMGESERKWVAWQMCRALSNLHAMHQFHGDLKCENVLGTSWGWILLSDMCVPGLKSVRLASDNPSGFSFAFDAGDRRRCYVAPERFVSSDALETSPSTYTEAMDVFSLGCCLAEVWLGGEPLFDLGGLLAYRGGQNSEGYNAKLDRIDDAVVRRLVRTMTAMDPEKRGSAWDAALALDTPSQMYTRQLAPLGVEAASVLDQDTRVVLWQHRCELLLDGGRGAEEEADAGCCEGLAAMGCGFLRRGCRVPQVLRAGLGVLAQKLATRVCEKTRVWAMLPLVCFLVCESRNVSTVRKAAVDATADVLLHIALGEPDGILRVGEVVQEVVLPALARAANDEALSVKLAAVRRLADVGDAALRAGCDRGRVGSFVFEVMEVAGDRNVGVRQEVLERKTATRICDMLPRQMVEERVGPLWLGWTREDPEWRVRFAFLEGGCVALAKKCSKEWLETEVRPAVLASLVDPEDHIAAGALEALTHLRAFDVKSVAPLLAHPSPWLRRRACSSLAAFVGGSRDRAAEVWHDVEPFLADEQQDSSLLVCDEDDADGDGDVAERVHEVLRPCLTRAELDKQVQDTMLAVQEEVDAGGGTVGLEEALARIAELDTDDSAVAAGGREQRHGRSVKAYVGRMAVRTRVRMMEWEVTNEARLRSTEAEKSTGRVYSSTLLDKRRIQSSESVQESVERAVVRPRGRKIGCEQHGAAVASVFPAFEGRFAVSCSTDGTARVWGVGAQGGRSVACYRAQEGGELVGGCGMGTGMAATGSDGGSVHVWRIKDDQTEAVRAWQVRVGGATSVISVNEHVVAVASDGGTVSGYDVRSSGDRPAWEASLASPGARTRATCMAAEPGEGGRWVCVGTAEGVMNVVDLRHAEKRCVSSWTCAADGRGPAAMAVAPQTLRKALGVENPRPGSAPLVAVASGEDECGVWDLEMGKLVGRLQVRRGGDELAPMKRVGHRFTCVETEWGGDALATAGSDGTVRLWDVRKPEQSYFVVGSGQTGGETKPKLSGLKKPPTLLWEDRSSSPSGEFDGDDIEGEGGLTTMCVIAALSGEQTSLGEGPSSDKVLVTGGKDGTVTMWR